MKTSRTTTAKELLCLVVMLCTSFSYAKTFPSPVTAESRDFNTFSGNVEIGSQADVVTWNTTFRSQGITTIQGSVFIGGLGVTDLSILPDISIFFS